MLLFDFKETLSESILSIKFQRFRSDNLMNKVEDTEISQEHNFFFFNRYIVSTSLFVCCVRKDNDEFCIQNKAFVFMN